jgi:uroporphyrinogen decarboxylase
MAREDFLPRELVSRALNHEETPRVPFAIGWRMNQLPKLALMAYLGHGSPGETDAFLARFQDTVGVDVPYIGPPHRRKNLPGGRNIDIWGVIREPVSYAKGGVYHEICHYPLAEARTLADLDAFEWPSPDWFDYGALPDALRQVNPDGRLAVILGNGNPFERAWYMRGFEQALMDLALEPELIQAILERVTAFFLEYFDRALSAAKGGIDLAFTADDIAGQGGLLMSPEVWRSQLKPWHQKLNARLHEHGVKILYHTDGAAHSLLEDLIDMGIDAWEALQLDAQGMDAGALKAAAGNRLAFHGGISVQQLLPFAAPDEVRAETARLMRVLGRGGGYIAAPSHAVQAGTPPENIAAMLETVRPDVWGAYVTATGAGKP